MNFRERLERDRVKRQPANDNMLVVENIRSDYFGISNIPNMPACLDLRFSEGGRVAMPYSYINEIRFEPANEILILTNTKKIKIIGRDLEKLYDYLAMFRVRFVKALAGDDFEESGLCVNEIVIEDI